MPELLSLEEISFCPSETRLWLTITISGMSSAGNNDDTIEKQSLSSFPTDKTTSTPKTETILLVSAKLDFFL